MPGNTVESFDAALACGVDMIEFDVLPERGSGRLIMAHDYGDAARRKPQTLSEGLDHLARSGVGLDVDMKLPGYEREVVAALAARGLVARSIISSSYRKSLAVVRMAEPAARVGWSVPRAARDYTKSPLYALPALAYLAYLRRFLPGRASRALRQGLCQSIMAHWRVVTEVLLRSVHDAEGELYIWTVDDRNMIDRYRAMGVDGIITNDPRIF